MGSAVKSCSGSLSNLLKGVPVETASLGVILLGREAAVSHALPASAGGNFRRTFRTIAPHEFPQKVWTNDRSI